MKKYHDPKICMNCGEKYIPTGNCQKYCEECRYEMDLQRMRDYHKRTYVRKGYNQYGENNNNWKGGVAAYRNRLEKVECEICGSTENLLIHHRDHDRSNNAESNLMVLCKRCHQEHHCTRDPLTGQYTKHS